MGTETYQAVKAQLESSAPLGRTATADTVAEAILYFLSGASIVTGETLILDGGQHLMQMPFAREQQLARGGFGRIFGDCRLSPHHQHCRSHRRRVDVVARFLF